MKLSLREAFRDRIAQLEAPSEDALGAAELGISVAKFTLWKRGFYDTYVVAGAVPIEVSQGADITLYCQNPHIRKPSYRTCRNIKANKWRKKRRQKS